MAITLLPNAGQSLGETRDPIRINFQTIDTSLQVDHIQLDLAAADAGKHKAVHLVNQAGAPAAPVTGIGEMALYSSLVGGVAQLFLKNENLGAGVDGLNLSGGNLLNGWCQLPNGIIIKWGNQHMAFGASNIPNFYLVGENPIDPAIPMITTPYCYFANHSYNAGEIYGSIGMRYDVDAPRCNYTIGRNTNVTTPGGITYCYIVIGTN